MAEHDTPLRRGIPVPLKPAAVADREHEHEHEHETASHDSDDDIIVGLSYARYRDELSVDSESLVSSDQGCGACAETTRANCGRFAAFQEKYLGPLSPERAPGYWMVANAFCLSWSLSLGVYLVLLYAWYGNETAASKATTTHYLLWSLLTTLVWVVEISLRAAFPGLDTFLVVATPNNSDDEHDSEEAAAAASQPEQTQQRQRQRQRQPPQTGQQIHPPLQHRLVSRTFTAEESVVTLETTKKKRSKKHLMVIATELLLAVFFGVETILDCWNHWHHRHGGGDSSDSGDEIYEDDWYYHYIWDEYYGYIEDAERDHYSMLQQQSDIWINVLAYLYMTYETYHEYYMDKAARRDIQRSLTWTVVQHQSQRHLQQQQQSQSQRHLQHQHQSHQQQQQQQQQQQLTTLPPPNHLAQFSAEGGATRDPFARTISDPFARTVIPNPSASGSAKAAAANATKPPPRFKAVPEQQQQQN
jgi:hypothetical protein